MDRIEHINKLIQKDIVLTRRESTVLNNMYSFITIIIMSIVIIIYTNFIVDKKEEKQVVELTPHQQYLEERRKRIELSHKLNNINLDKNYE